MRNQHFKWKVDNDGQQMTTDELVLEKLHCLPAGGAKKLSGHVWDNNILCEKLTMTDESSLEKLCCLSAGGAKKITSTK